jgi:hypothetical protein
MTPFIKLMPDKIKLMICISYSSFRAKNLNKLTNENIIFIPFKPNAEFLVECLYNN